MHIQQHAITSEHLVITPSLQVIHITDQLQAILHAIDWLTASREQTAVTSCATALVLSEIEDRNLLLEVRDRGVTDIIRSIKHPTLLLDGRTHRIHTHRSDAIQQMDIKRIILAKRSLAGDHVDPRLLVNA